VRKYVLDAMCKADAATVEEYRNRDITLIDQVIDRLWRIVDNKDSTIIQPRPTPQVPSAGSSTNAPRCSECTRLSYQRFLSLTTHQKTMSEPAEEEKRQVLDLSLEPRRGTRGNST
jgi:hypothetical protein